MNAILNMPLDFQQAFNALPGLFLVLMPDSPRFTILAATDAYLQATRQRRDDVLGRSLFEAFACNPGDTGCKAELDIRASLERVIEQRMPHAMAVQCRNTVWPQTLAASLEMRYWRPVNSPVMSADADLACIIHRIEDATELVLARQAAVHRQASTDEASPLWSKHASLGDSRLATLNLMQDAVTARQQAKQTRAKLQASEERLRLATDAAGLGIWTWQPEGDHLTWENERSHEILGIASHALPLDMGRLVAEFVHPDDRASFRQAFADAVQTGARLFCRCRFQCPNAELRWVEFTGQPLQKQGGSLLRVVGTLCDITERKRAEEALGESRRFLRSSLDALSGLMAVLDESGTILEVNEAWRRFALENNARMEGVSVGVNYLQQCESVSSQGGEMPAYAQGIRDVIAGRRIRFELEYPCHSPAQERWFVMRVTRFQSPGPVRVVIMHEECTEQKRVEEALRISKARYRSLFNSMDEGCCIVNMIFDTDEQPVDFQFLEVNHAFGKQTGVHGVAGKRLREMDSFMATGLLRICGKVALAGKPVRTAYEVKKGSHSLWFDIYATRVSDQESARVAIVFNNITQRIKAEDALRLSEQRLRALFDRGPLAMYSCDASGTIQEFNACAVSLWGRTPTQGGVGEKFSGALKLYLPDGTVLSHAQTATARVLRGELPRAVDEEDVIEQPGGSRITVMSNVVPLRNGRGDITGAINCFYDITERSRLERKTQEQAQALADLHLRKDEFLAMLSHELRNPLAPLASAVDLLRLHKSEAPQHSQALEVIERQVGQLKHLVDDLLDVSRITSGSIRLRSEPVSIQDIVHRAVETTHPLILQRRHQLAVAMPPQTIWLMADPMRLEQVLVNLLINAVKYTDEGGCIWLSVELEDSPEMNAPVVLVKVRDNGIGIAAELLPRIFDLFTQAERSIDRSQGGLGIGLCLVQQLVKLHAGSVKAFSVPGQGSEFAIRLPAMPAATPREVLAKPPVLAPVRPRGKGCRVLAVDDNVDAVNILARLLEMSGHEVQTAYDGSSVLQRALAMQPDVVFLDIGLPGLTGYEVAEQLRQQPALANILLVALTGYGQDRDRQRSREAGFDHHLVKPVDFREIEKMMAIAVQQAG